MKNYVYTDQREGRYGNKRRHINLYIGLILMVVLTGIIILCILSGNSKLNPNDSEVVVVINGEPLTVQEFKLHFNANIASVYTDFHQKYKVQDSQGFWSKSYGGEVPNKVLRNITLQECIVVKVQQILMKRKGIVTDISYQCFLKGFAAENKRRRKALTGHRVMYGPDHYSEAEYWDYVFGNQVAQLKQRMAGTEIPVDETILQNYYEAFKTKRYSLGEELTVQVIALHYVNSQGTATLAQKQSYQELAAVIQKRLNKGESFESMAKAYNRDHSVMQLVFSPAKGRSQYTFYGDLINASGTMQTGQISPVIERNGEFDIIKLIRRKNLGYIPFSQCESIVRQNYLDIKYQELIQKMVSEAKIKINHDVFNKLTVR